MKRCFSVEKAKTILGYQRDCGGVRGKGHSKRKHRKIVSPVKAHTSCSGYHIEDLAPMAGYRTSTPLRSLRWQLLISNVRSRFIHKRWHPIHITRDRTASLGVDVGRLLLLTKSQPRHVASFQHRFYIRAILLPSRADLARLSPSRADKVPVERLY